MNVAAKQKRPHVARSTTRRNSGKKQSKCHFMDFWEERESEAIRNQRHEEELTHEADDWPDRFSHDVFNCGQVDRCSEVDVQN